MRKPKELPILLDPSDVRHILGRIPRDLENMVVCDPRNKGHERKLYSRREVLKRAKR